MTQDSSSSSAYLNLSISDQLLSHQSKLEQLQTCKVQLDRLSFILKNYTRSLDEVTDPYLQAIEDTMKMEDEPLGADLKWLRPLGIERTHALFVEQLNVTKIMSDLDRIIDRYTRIDLPNIGKRILQARVNISALERIPTPMMASRSISEPGAPASDALPQFSFIQHRESMPSSLQNDSPISDNLSRTSSIILRDTANLVSGSSGDATPDCSAEHQMEASAQVLNAIRKRVRQQS